MPETLQAALAIALLIAPGYLLIQGYGKSRAFTPPDRDVYVLAQAVVASVGWLAIVALCVSVLGDPSTRWGLLPPNRSLLEHHVGPIALSLVVVEFAPFALGFAAGYIVNALQRLERARPLFEWTGIYEPPTAWEYAWMEAASRASVAGGPQSIDVSVRLKGGGTVEGRYGSSSRMDLAPRPSHQIYLETGYGIDHSESPAKLLGDGTIGGVFIDASEIAAIYFKT